MRKSGKQLSLSTNKLPNLTISNAITSPRSATEAMDTFSNQPTLAALTSTHIRQDSSASKRYELLSPSISPFQLEKPRKSVPDVFKISSGASSSKKIYSNTDRHFRSIYDVPETVKMNTVNTSTNLVTHRRKRDEIANMKIWDNEQSSNIKKLLFFIQEMHSKIGDFNLKFEGCGTVLSQITTQIENGIYALLTSFNSTLNNAYAEEAKITKKLGETQENLKNLEANHQMKNKLEYERIEKLKKELSQSIKNKELEDNSQYLMVQKLKNENEYLQERLENIIRLHNLDHLSKELETTRADTKLKTEHYESELRDRELLLARFEIMYNGTKKMNENLGQTNKDLEYKIVELHMKYNSHQQAIEKLEEERNMYRERSLMQLADYEGLQLELDSMQDNFLKMRERYITEREKSDKLNALQLIHESSSSTFDQEVQLLEAIKNSLYSGPGRHLNLKKDQEKVEKTAEPESKHYMYSKPTYQSLFDKNKLYLKMKEVKINVEFVAMLRAIYDSKYNELICADNYSQVSRFPDFVYSWIGKFVLDSRSRMVRTADLKDPDPEIIRNEIITHLHSTFSSRMWECITFKEFLDEVHTRDELAYFLHCRHFLFKGPQLNNPSSTFTFNYYVKIEWAEYVLDQLLGYKHSPETIALMKSRFRERTKQKKGNVLIDSGFFLRILLEEYKKEKLEKFAAYRKTFMKDGALSSSNGKFSIPFETFKGFINAHFPETYDLEKSELYRKCWIYTNGNIDVDGMLMILNEENFFSKGLTFSSFEGKFVPQNLPARTNEKLGNNYAFIVRKYQQLDEHMDYLHEGVEKLGVERYLVDYQEFERCMKTYFSTDNADFQGKDLYLVLKIFFLRCYKLNNVLLHLDQTQKETNVHDYAKNIFLTFKENFERVLLEGEDMQVKEFELNVKAKKLQKFFRSKISSWYKLMKLIIKNKLKKFYDERGNLHFKNV